MTAESQGLQTNEQDILIGRSSSLFQSSFGTAEDLQTPEEDQNVLISLHIYVVLLTQARIQ